MLAHLSISHMAIGGGDQPPQSSPKVGLLGADFAVDRGRYRIERIYHGDPSDPLNPGVTSPLAQPGLGIAEGDVLLAVDGQDVSTTVDLYQYLAGKAGKPVQLKFQSKSGRATRTVSVEPLSDETTLRRLTWAADNRRAVDRLSHGRLAYVYLADHELVGYTTFVQDFFAQRDKQGIIVDQRFNPGGYSPDALIETLTRVPLSAYRFRAGRDAWFPLSTLPGPRVLIANEFNGSGAESFAAMWRRAHVGTIVGERTTGGGIGPYVNIPRLIDGGFVSAPNRAFFDPFERVWGIENHGVAPDVEVDWSPEAWRAHRDPQLERAVEVAMKSLQAHPPPELVPPKPPVYP
jgi:tricorn protease